MTRQPSNAPDRAFHYIPNTDDDRADMLKTVGVASVDDLFQDIPAGLRNPPLDIPAPLSELDLKRELQSMADSNRNLAGCVSFLGGGAYNHFSPSVVRAIISRGEFLTAYTPYQPEVSQGTLQVTYDFQTMVCSLFGMEVSDAGMYDGASAVAEAALMACRVTGRDRVVILDTVSSSYQQVVRAYTQGLGIDIAVSGASSLEVTDETACVIVQYPNFFGYLDDLTGMEARAHGKGALLVVSANPVAMGMLKPPGEYGADIVTGEGQALGIPPSYGGPYLGLFTARRSNIRQMPGRIAGKTVDGDGRTGYVLTLSTREQHIRRERATSNICTNEALMTLAATVYMAALGKAGLRHVAELSYHKAHYAASLIENISGFTLPIDAPFFNEFTVRCPAPPAEINRRLLERNIIGGLDVSDRVPNGMLLCVTEMNSRRDIEDLAAALASGAV